MRSIRTTESTCGRPASPAGVVITQYSPGNWFPGADCVSSEVQVLSFASMPFNRMCGLQQISKVYPLISFIAQGKFYTMNL